MAQEKIRVMIVDDFADTRESIGKLLYFEKDIEVVASVGDGQTAIQKAREIHPHVILMDINMPGTDGIAATEGIVSVAPECEVIMMSVQGEADYLRRAMLAGAREYLIKPFTGDELAGSIRHLYELSADKRARMAAALTPPAPQPAVPAKPVGSGQLISIFSPKGGVGKTTIATNLAIGLKLLTGKKVALVDGNLAFGDVGVMLNLPNKSTIADLIPNMHALDMDLLDRIMVDHGSGVKVLLAPPRPELAELVAPDHLRAIATLLKQHYDYVVMDTLQSFEDMMLAVLDLSDRIILLTTLEMPAIKNIKLFLEVAEALHYSREKLMLVINRADSSGGILVEEVEQNIRFKVAASIVSSGQLMTTAVNQGVPVVVSQRDSAVSKNLLDLARAVMSEEDLAAATERAAADPARSNRKARSWLGLGRLRFFALAPFASRRGAD